MNGDENRYFFIKIVSRGGKFYVSRTRMSLGRIGPEWSETQAEIKQEHGEKLCHKPEHIGFVRAFHSNESSWSGLRQRHRFGDRKFNNIVNDRRRKIGRETFGSDMSSRNIFSENPIQHFRAMDGSINASANENVEHQEH